MNGHGTAQLKDAFAERLTQIGGLYYNGHTLDANKTTVLAMFTDPQTGESFMVRPGQTIGDAYSAFEDERRKRGQEAAHEGA